MVYGVPIEQLMDRIRSLTIESELNNTMTSVYEADRLYHSMCVRGNGALRNNPFIQRAQQDYIAALEAESTGASLPEVQEGIISATCELTRALFDFKILT